MAISHPTNTLIHRAKWFVWVLGVPVNANMGQQYSSGNPKGCCE